MTQTTRTKWAERVKRWKASGQSAETFAEGAGFKPGTLRWWSSELKREAPSMFVDATSLVSSAADTALVLEVGAVRIRVSHGFDATLLREVLAALEAR